MAKLKALIMGKVKDKASIGKVRLLQSFSSTSVRYIYLALLKSTNHDPHKPPNSDYVSAVVSYSNSRYATQAFTATMWRLHVTKNAFVATKSLIIFHKLMKSSKHVFGGLDHGGLKLNDFTDKSSSFTLELSQWVRWYAMYLDTLSSISNELGSFPKLAESSKEKANEKDCVSSYQTARIMRQINSLVTFFEHLCARPETPPRFQNKILDEIRELLIQDYFTVVRLVMVRLQVLSERLTKHGFEHVGGSSLNDLRMTLVKLKNCKESLSGFSWRGKSLAESFWYLVEKLKDDEEIMVELSNLVQTTVNEEKEIVESAGSGHNEWVTFDDFEMVMNEVVNHDSEWVTFDDSKRWINEPVLLSLCT